MLQPLLLHRSLIAGAAFAVLSLASPWAATARADAAQVTVVNPSGREQALSLAALAGSEDVVDRAYTLRSAASENTQTLTGFSLASVLDAAGADPYAFSYVEVQRPAGGAVLLSRDQALDGRGDGPPIVYATASGTGFLRPSAGAEDLNADDSFEAPQGISLVLRKGSPLRVRARASKLWTRPGQPVRFSAVVDRSGAGEQLAYSWYFDDGDSASGPEVSHSFAKRGSYDVVVGITSEGNDTGTSDVVTIQVGAPVTGGPNRDGGGNNRADDAPDHGAADGPESGAGGAAGPGTELGEGSGGRPPTDTRRGRRPRVRRGMTDRPAPDPVPAPAGQRVVGELLSESENASAVPPRADRAAARRGELEGNDGGGGLPTAAWGLLATLGLLGTGALIEVGGIGALRLRGRSV